MEEMNNGQLEYHEHPKKLSLAGRMAKAFVKNRQLNLLAILFIVLLGIGGFILMPKAYNPDIVAPAFVITTPFPGATADQVHELITRPMEDAISQLPGIDQLVSQSFDGGQSAVMVQFKVGTSADSAKVALTQKLRDNMDLKPIGASDPSVVTLDPDDVPVMSIAITSHDRSPEALRKLAFAAADEIKHIDGTSVVSVAGGRADNLQIRLDAGKMSQYHIAVSDVMGVLEATNGIYSAEPLQNGNDTATVRISGSIASPEDAAKVVVIPSQDAPVYLGDIADISVGPGEITDAVSLTKKGGQEMPAAYVTVAKLKGANISSVTQGVRAKISEIGKKPEFSSVDFQVTRDDGQTAHEEIATLTKHLTISIIVVVVVLMAFLGIRNALIVAIAIPLTLLVSFGVGLFAGQTINRITLFALILALGLLVDDAIVIIENIHRTIKNNPGKNKSTLIVAAVDEVGMGVFMSTVTILLAFIPMAFVSGMMGPYMAPIPFFVSVTMLASLAIAFTINPALTGMFMSGNDKERENIFVRFMHRIENSYARLIGTLVSSRRKKNLVLAGAALLLVASLALPILKIVQFRMLPKADKEQFYIYLDMPQSSSFERTDAVSEKIQGVALGFPNVESVENFTGTPPIADFNGMFKGSFMRSGENQATLKVNLVPHTERNIPSEKIALELRDRLQNDVLSGEPDARIVMVEDPPGPPVRSTFFLKIQGDDQTLIEAAAQDIEQMSKGIQGITDIEDSLSQRSFEKQYKVDTEKAGRLGIQPATIIQTLHASLSGTDVARYGVSSNNQERHPEQQFVTLRMRQEDRSDNSDLSLITVRSAAGAAVPISELLIPDQPEKSSSTATDNRFKTVYVSGEMAERSVIYAVLDLFPKLLHYRLPNGTGHVSSWSPLGVTYQDSQWHKMSVRIDGEWKITLDVFRDLGIAMGAALILIYFVLVVQIRSLMVPLLIMATIPLAMIGVLGGFAILGIAKGTFFNATSMIGVIALAGIVVKNAIIYLNYLDELKARKMALKEALMEAGRIRLLPIILTSLTAILGSLTIIADPVWEGLAWAIIFGLSVSTVLTLVIFPLLYLTTEESSWSK